MHRLQQLAFGLSRIGAAAGAVVLLIMIGMILYEIVLRSFFSSSTFVLDEMVGYGTAALTFLGLGYALETGRMIRVGILIDQIPQHGRLRLWVELLCVISTTGLLSLAIGAFARTLIRHFERGTDSGTLAAVPLWIPEGVVLLGMAIFWLQLLAYLIRVASGQQPGPLVATNNLSGN